MNSSQRYLVQQFPLQNILSWVQTGEIAIPEIQRPFVWPAIKVRDLLDSLYKGYPIGYLIIWKNPNIRLKDGGISVGKKILIDGQQRIMALKTSVLNSEVVNKDYTRGRIKIAFNPMSEEFAVLNPAYERDKNWFPDVSLIISGVKGALEIIDEYCTLKPETDRNKLLEKIDRLREIRNRPIGIIELDAELDIETVTDVFIRINSLGVELSQADFAMSKIAANETYGGFMLRRCIDYFCHMAVNTDFYNYIKDNDTEFVESIFFPKMAWLKDENDDIYDPSYTDMLRVAFTSQFERGKLSDLVSLLSGRNFELKTYEEEIAKESFGKLEQGILEFINESSFKRFLMIIRSAGFISPNLIRSQNTLNFAYILYLKLRAQNYDQAIIESLVRKWFVLSILTGRYSGSPESVIDLDIRNMSLYKLEEYLNNVENAELSVAFWDYSLVQHLDSSVSSSPYFNVFLASQVKAGDKGFLSRDITVKDMIIHRGDIHHIFPKDYLKSGGLKRDKYNQIANYAYTQTEINIKIGNDEPKKYISDVIQQCNDGILRHGGITDISVLHDNMKMNCIPTDIYMMEFSDYGEFLAERRKLIALKIKDYYHSL